MEGSSLLTFSSSTYPKTQLGFQHSPSSSSSSKCRFLTFFPNSLPKSRVSVSCPRSSLRASFLAAEEDLEKSVDSASSATTNGREMGPKIDKSGRFCSPRAARELALRIHPLHSQPTTNSSQPFPEAMEHLQEHSPAPSPSPSETSAVYYSCDENGGDVSCTKVTAELIFALVSVLLEIASAVLDKLSSPEKPYFGLICIVLAFAVLVACIAEQVYNRRKGGANWKPSSPDVVGVVFATLQCVLTIVSYTCYLRHHRNSPIIQTSAIGFAISFVFVKCCSVATKNTETSTTVPARPGV